MAKAELFEEELQEKANLFNALAHPLQLQIMQYLVQTKTYITGDILDMFTLTRTMNKHFKEK